MTHFRCRFLVENRMLNGRVHVQVGFNSLIGTVAYDYEMESAGAHDSEMANAPSSSCKDVAMEA
jgi:hypothetical protein